MTIEFMRALTHEPVFEDKGNTVLSKRIANILDRLTYPVAALEKCIDYLDGRIYQMNREFSNRSFQIRNRNPYKIGTMAWLKFMRYKCIEIKTAYGFRMLTPSE